MSNNISNKLIVNYAKKGGVGKTTNFTNLVLYYNETLNINTGLITLDETSYIQKLLIKEGKKFTVNISDKDNQLELIKNYASKINVFVDIPARGVPYVKDLLVIADKIFVFSKATNIEIPNLLEELMDLKTLGIPQEKIMVVFNSINLEHKRKEKNIEKLNHINYLENEIRKNFGIKNFAIVKFLDLYEEFNHHNIIAEVISNRKYGSDMYNIRNEFNKILNFLKN